MKTRTIFYVFGMCVFLLIMCSVCPAGAQTENDEESGSVCFSYPKSGHPEIFDLEGKPIKSYAGSDLWDDNTGAIPATDIPAPDNAAAVYEKIDRIRSAEPREEKELIQELVESREDILPALIFFARNGNEDFWVEYENRLVAICVLGKMGAKAKPALPALLWALRDVYDEYQVMITEAAVSAIDPEHGGEYVRAAREDMERGWWWGWYFENTRDKKDLPALTRALSHWNQYVRFGAMTGIIQIGPDASMATALLDILKNDPEGFNKELAFKALLKISPPPVELVPELLQIIDELKEDIEQYGYDLVFPPAALAFKIDPGNPELQKLMAGILSTIDEASSLYVIIDELFPVACGMNPTNMKTMAPVFKLMEHAPEALLFTRCLFHVADCSGHDAGSAEYEQCLAKCEEFSYSELDACIEAGGPAE